MISEVFSQRGFTLLEILVALTLTSFLLMSIYPIFSSSLQHTKMQTALWEVQENARVATWVLQQAVRDAGHIGCLSVSPTWQVAQQVAQLSYIPSMLSGEMVYGYAGENDQWLPALPEALQDKVLPNTDVVVLEKSDLRQAQLAIDMNDATDAIELNRENIFAHNDIVTISDCGMADLFQISQVRSGTNGQIILHETPQNIQDNLQKPYSKLAQVSRWTVQAFYINQTARKNQQGQPIYALYTQGLLPASSRIEIVEGVSDFRILYGVSTSPGGPFVQWLTANQLSSDWHVVSVSFIVLLQSTDNVLDSPQSYEWLGETVTATDKRLYRVWQIEVALRNV